MVFSNPRKISLVLLSFLSSQYVFHWGTHREARLGCRVNLYSSDFQLIIIHVFCSIQVTENPCGWWIATVDTNRNTGEFQPLEDIPSWNWFHPSALQSSRVRAMLPGSSPVWHPQSPCTMEQCCPREQVLAWDNAGAGTPGQGIEGLGVPAVPPFSILSSFLLHPSCIIILLPALGGFHHLGRRVWVWFCKWTGKSPGLLKTRGSFKSRFGEQTQLLLSPLLLQCLLIFFINFYN